MHMLKKLGRYSNYGTLILRLVVGIVFIFHGYLKLVDLEGTAGFLGSLGFPAAGFFALILTLVEFLGGISLVLGLFTRYFSLLIAVDMLIAFLLVHASNGFLVNNGGYEFVLTLFGAAIFLLLHGPGKYSLDKKLAKK